MRDSRSKCQMTSYLICLCIIVVTFLFWYGYVLLKPLPGAFIRYLAWTTTPAATALRGSVKAGDATIHYVSYGSGPAVLLLHGGLSNRLIWFSQIPWLVDWCRETPGCPGNAHQADVACPSCDRTD